LPRSRSPPATASTLVNRGVLHMIAGGFVEAERNFDSATAVDPTAADPWLNKAFLRLRQGNGSAALPLLERAMQLDADREALAYFARGLAYEQAGDFRAAYADLRRASRLDPDWDLPAQQLARYEVRSR
jgi:tetratricopeptide (TPR) repeat protein